MANTDTLTSWSTADLDSKIIENARFFVFDVRNRDEHDALKIEGRTDLATANVPYFEMLETATHDDIVDTFEEYLSTEWAEKLPRDMPILTVCAKGETSEYVAQALRRLGYLASSLTGGTVAWGNHYAVHRVPTDEGPAIYQLSRPARGCLSYLIESDGVAVVVDPLRHIQNYLDLAASVEAKIGLIIDTHGHADHISGGAALARKTGAPYLLHPYDGIHPIDVLPATVPYGFLEDNQRFELGEIEIMTLHIPGHTLGNVALLLNGSFLFTGDSIFVESIARPDLGGRGETWAPLHYQSLRRLMALADEIVVLPGHFSHRAEARAGQVFGAQLGELKQENEGLLQAQGNEQDFVKYILASLPRFPEEYIEIKRVNAGLSDPDEERSSELELGKNVCALA